nr:hypothetical protein Q903MT_gene3041 [Picea sitchensis]
MDQQVNILVQLDRLANTSSFWRFNGLSNYLFHCGWWLVGGWLYWLWIVVGSIASGFTLG